MNNFPGSGGDASCFPRRRPTLDVPMQHTASRRNVHAFQYINAIRNTVTRGRCSPLVARRLFHQHFSFPNFFFPATRNDDASRGPGLPSPALDAYGIALISLPLCLGMGF